MAARQGRCTRMLKLLGNYCTIRPPWFKIWNALYLYPFFTWSRDIHVCEIRGGPMGPCFNSPPQSRIPSSRPPFLLYTSVPYTVVLLIYFEVLVISKSALYFFCHFFVYVARPHRVSFFFNCRNKYDGTAFDTVDINAHSFFAFIMVRFVYTAVFFIFLFFSDQVLQMSYLVFDF